jgi:hypothetical protein
MPATAFDTDEEISVVDPDLFWSNPDPGSFGPDPDPKLRN